MSSVDYENWAEYLKDLIFDWNEEPNSVLELGAGTGLLTQYMGEEYSSIFMLDISKGMLASKKLQNTYKVAADMRTLPFKYEFDVIYSSFDTINYILSEEELSNFFIEMRSIMSKNSIFTFDVSLEKNSLKYQHELNRSGKIDGLHYNQISKYDQENRIHSNIFEITDSEGNLIVEKHEQKIYELFDYFRLIESGGLWVSACYDGFTFNLADENSERAQFVIKRN